jgi:hypothetical protein
LSKSCGNHTLILTRHEDDRDALFVVQELRTLTPDFSWMAEATNWGPARLGGIVA